MWPCYTLSQSPRHLFHDGVSLNESAVRGIARSHSTSSGLDSHIQVERILGLLLEGRSLCANFLKDAVCDASRAVDVVYLDISLAAAIRTCLEGHLGELSQHASAISNSTGVLCYCDSALDQT
jgi:hypothetical protein